MRLVFGDCELDLERYELRRAAEVVPLEPKAFKVLAYLVQRHGRAVAKQDLLAAFWPGAAVDNYTEYALRNCLLKIRQAVGDAQRPASVIETVRGYGYRFVAPVTALAPAPDTAGMAPQEPPPLGSAPTPAVGHPRLPEQRPLTVLRCGLVSTGPVQRLDPEAFQRLVQAFYAACEATIVPFAGYIAQYDSDEVLIYFGYPVAYEDAALRAVRAGLALVEAVHRLELPRTQVSGLRPSARLSVHTGPVIVGTSEEAIARTPMLSGAMLSVGKRLQAESPPNTVLISAATYALVQGYVVCEALPQPLAAPGEDDLARYRVLRESPAQSRFEVAVARGLTPLVGRDTEMALLRERWAQVQEGLGQVVLLCGEPGIGKSRLAQELREHSLGTATTQHVWRCAPAYQHSAFYPLMAALERELAVTADETADARLRTLEALLTPCGLPLPAIVPLFAALLGLPAPAHYPSLALTPQQQRQKTLDAVIAWLLAEAQQQPVLVLVEDLHWSDPSLVELLSLLLDQVPTVRLMLLLTCRPEFQPPWPTRAHVTPLTLARLPRPQVAHLVATVAGAQPLPRAVVEQVVAQTDGVPLFVEELTKTVLELGLLCGDNEPSTLAGARSPLTIPPTLHDLLMTRLDRLATGKIVAQLGATIGRTFAYGLLQAITPLDEVSLQYELARLVETELLYQRGAPPQATYTFKHALIQDAAYQSLLRSTRQQYHQRIAQALEERFPETAETQPELLAHHYADAGLAEHAIAYWQRAGQQALQRSASLEAVQLLRKGLDLLATLPDTWVRAQQELDLLISLGSALQATKGHAAPEVDQIYARARALCTQIGDTLQLLPTLRGLCMFYRTRGVLPTARELGEQLYRLAQRTAEPTHLLEAHDAFGNTLFQLGEYAAAWAHIEQGIALIDPAVQRAQVLRHGEAPGVRCLGYAAWTLWCLGYPAQAVRRSQEALVLAQELAHPFPLVQAQYHTANLHYRRREIPAVQAQVDVLLPLATAQGFPLFVGYGTYLRGWVLAMQGEGEVGLVQIRQGLAIVLATGSALSRPLCLLLLAEAAGQTGQVEEGLRLLAEALTALEANRQGDLLAEAYRLQGEFLLQQTPSDAGQAEACLQQALAIARRQQAKSWELRAATSLARLWQGQGKRNAARTLLTEVYGWFTEGFDTADLQDAKALLEELEG